MIEPNENSHQGDIHDLSFATILLRNLARLAAILVLAWMIHLLVGWIMVETETLKGASHIRFGLIMLLLLAYAVLIAVPFVPGVELGVSLMFLQGGAMVPLVYMATVIGLLLAFVIGAWAPYSFLRKTLADLHMKRAQDLLVTIEAMSREQRLGLISSRLPARFVPLLVRHRYMALAVIVNLPGNSVVGGGGGIMLIAGLSRLFAFPPMVLTCSIGVAPVPLLVWFYDFKLLQW